MKERALYVATDDLKVAVNAAIALERPLLVKGEPGTGKTVLAIEIAKALGAPLIEWHIKSTTKALQGLYEYDAVTRLRDSQLGDARVKDIRNYIKRGKLWEAFTADERPVLLIDEVDKADIEFPNDLLQELDRMEFFVYETGETVHARRRPIVVITSNNEKELPDAFLRRCFFHYIRFPDPDTMRAIVEVHFPGVKQRLVAEALRLFYEIRDVPGMKKKPSTSELLDERGAPRDLQDADGARFVGRGEDEAAVFLDELLRRLAHLAAEDHIELVELPGEIGQRRFVGEGEEHDEIRAALELREQPAERDVHVFDREPVAEPVAQAAPIEHARRAPRASRRGR